MLSLNIKKEKRFIFLKRKTKKSFFVHTKTGDFMIENIANTDFVELIDVVLRSVLSLLTLFLVTKMLGKKQVSELSLFDYVIGISIGNFAAEMTINTDSQYLNGILAVIMFGFVAYFVSIFTMKSISLRRYFMGVPTILMQDGKILEKNLRKVKFTLNDLQEECRSAGYFDLSEINYAIMEANGKLSILPKVEYREVTLKDLKIKEKENSLVANVIIDGKVMTNNLKNMKKTYAWLEKEMKKKGYLNFDNVLLATLDNSENLIIYERNLKLKSKDILE